MHTRARAHTHTRARTHTRMHTRARTHAHTHARTCPHTHTHMHTHAHAHAHICTHARTYTHMHTRAHTHMHKHAHTASNGFLRSRTVNNVEGRGSALFEVLFRGIVCRIEENNEKLSQNNRYPGQTSEHSPAAAERRLNHQANCDVLTYSIVQSPS
jgi:hypothetical protein